MPLKDKLKEKEYRFTYNEMLILSPVLKQIMGRRNGNQ